MNSKKAKILRKFAMLSGQNLDLVVKTFKKATNQEAYIANAEAIIAHEEKTPGVTYGAIKKEVRRLTRRQQEEPEPTIEDAAEALRAANKTIGVTDGRGRSLKFNLTIPEEGQNAKSNDNSAVVGD